MHRPSVSGAARQSSSSHCMEGPIHEASSVEDYGGPLSSQRSLRPRYPRPRDQREGEEACVDKLAPCEDGEARDANTRTQREDEGRKTSSRRDASPRSSDRSTRHRLARSQVSSRRQRWCRALRHLRPPHATFPKRSVRRDPPWQADIRQHRAVREFAECRRLRPLPVTGGGPSQV